MTPVKFFQAIFIILLFSSFTILVAQIPPQINYQGRLTDTGGEPVTDGPYLIKFKLYGSEAGDDSLWSSGFQTVQVTSGLFNYILGSNIPISSDFFGPGSEPFLGITIGTDPEISPRTRMTSVAFSFQSLRSDSASIALDVVDDIISEQKIQTNAVNSDKILDGAIQFIDIGQNGAQEGDLIKWSAGAWVADNNESAGGWADDGNIVKLSGMNDSVGIGTDTPAAKLHVSHSETNDGATITGILSNLEVDGYSNDIYGIQSQVNSNDNDGAISGIYSSVSGSAPNKVAIYGSATGGGIMTGVHGFVSYNASNLSKYGMKAEAYGTGTNNIGIWAMAVGGTNNYAGFFQSGDLVVANGNVGIGTDSPTARLQIDGTPGVDGIMFPDGTLQTTAASIEIPLILNGSVNTGNKAIVEGITNDLDTEAKGIYGEHVNWGTYGYLGGEYGVYGAASSGGGGTPVVGETIGTGTRGTLGGMYGVVGFHGPSGNSGTLGTSYCGVEGSGNDNDGVLGISSTGNGVTGSSSTGIGVSGASSTLGVYGRCFSAVSSAAGVKGENVPHGITGFLGTPEYGVAGYGDINIAVYGESNSNTGIYGTSISGEGVKGTNTSGGNYGSLGTDSYGVHGYSAAGDAGYFDGNVAITGNLQNDGTITVGTPSADHQLHIETDNIIAGYFTSNNATPASVHVIHAEFTDNVDEPLYPAPDQIAVYGKSVHTGGPLVPGYGIGGYFEGGRSGIIGEVNYSGGTISYGVEGRAYGSLGNKYGVMGWAAGGGTNYGIYGTASSGAINWAGYFSGDCRVTGTFDNSKSTTIIDHPLDPKNKYLVHNTISSPDMMNIYNGNVLTDNSGVAEVILPDYFTALNKDYRYQLTVIGDFAQAIIAEEINDNRFVIRTDKPLVKVSWMVTGIRQDPYATANPTAIERDKSEKETGKYLHPEAYGLGKDLGIDYENNDDAQSDRNDR